MPILNRKKRIMHIISGDLWAGAEAQAFTLIKELQKNNHLHVALMNNGELAERLHLAGIATTIIDEQKLSSLQIILALRRLLFSFNPDLIHTHRQKENILSSIANLISIRAKSVRTTHGASEFSLNTKQRLQDAADKFVGRYLQQAIISVSDDLSRKLTTRFPKDKIHTINNGVSVEALLQARPAKDLKEKWPQKKHVGIIGRLEPVKRVDIFLQIAAIAKEPSHPLHNTHFHIIGDGKLRAELEHLATTLGLSDTATFHGHRSDIASCIRALDAVLMCSDHEGTPMTALETIALETPLIAHNVGGLAEILFGQASLLVDNHTPEGYAKQLATVLESQQKPRLNEIYTAEFNANKVDALYTQLLS